VIFLLNLYFGGKMRNVIGLVLCLFAGSANAAVVTFDDIASNIDIPVVSGGLLFTYNNPGIASAWNTGGGSSNNGTQALIIGFGAGVEITRDGGGLFSIDSLDAGLSWFTALSSFDINVGSEVITLGLGYDAYSFTSLTNISSLAISSGPADGYIAIDNINWSNPSAAPVPEPGLLVLLGVGLAGIGFSRKR